MNLLRVHHKADLGTQVRDCAYFKRPHCSSVLDKTIYRTRSKVVQFYLGKKRESKTYLYWITIFSLWLKKSYQNMRLKWQFRS